VYAVNSFSDGGERGIEYYLEHYGYIAVLIGTIIAGGTLLTMAGFRAHQGYMQLVPWVILAGFVGNSAESLISYFLGYRYGKALVAKHPAWKPRLDRVNRWMLRYRVLVVIWYRLLAGFRTGVGFKHLLEARSTKPATPFPPIPSEEWS
jgi:membrane protein DedA with SNARE-associated domain